MAFVNGVEVVKESSGRYRVKGTSIVGRNAAEAFSKYSSSRPRSSHHTSSSRHVSKPPEPFYVVNGRRIPASKATPKQKAQALAGMMKSSGYSQNVINRTTSMLSSSGTTSGNKTKAVNKISIPQDKYNPLLSAAEAREKGLKGASAIYYSQLNEQAHMSSEKPTLLNRVTRPTRQAVNAFGEKLSAFSNKLSRTRRQLDTTREGIKQLNNQQVARYNKLANKYNQQVSILKRQSKVYEKSAFYELPVTESSAAYERARKKAREIQNRQMVWFPAVKDVRNFFKGMTKNASSKKARAVYTFAEFPATLAAGALDVSTIPSRYMGHELGKREAGVNLYRLPLSSKAFEGMQSGKLNPEATLSPTYGLAPNQDFVFTGKGYMRGPELQEASYQGGRFIGEMAGVPVDVAWTTGLANAGVKAMEAFPKGFKVTNIGKMSLIESGGKKLVAKETAGWSNTFLIKGNEITQAELGLANEVPSYTAPAKGGMVRLGESFGVVGKGLKGSSPARNIREFGLMSYSRTKPVIGGKKGFGFFLSSSKDYSTLKNTHIIGIYSQNSYKVVGSPYQATKGIGLIVEGKNFLGKRVPWPKGVVRFTSFGRAKEIKLPTSMFEFYSPGAGSVTKTTTTFTPVGLYPSPQGGKAQAFLGVSGLAAPSKPRMVGSAGSRARQVELPSLAVTVPRMKVVGKARTKTRSRTRQGVGIVITEISQGIKTVTKSKSTYKNTRKTKSFTQPLKVKTAQPVAVLKSGKSGVIPISKSLSLTSTAVSTVSSSGTVPPLVHVPTIPEPFIPPLPLNLSLPSGGASGFRFSWPRFTKKKKSRSEATPMYPAFKFLATGKMYAPKTKRNVVKMRKALLDVFFAPKFKSKKKVKEKPSQKGKKRPNKSGKESKKGKKKKVFDLFNPGEGNEQAWRW